MSIAKPFTFTANTYAKASEVNADFDIVYSQVNTNISAIAQNATDIDNLENNKADINGSTSQRFAVADAISNSDAINKQTLFKAIGNSLDYISGLVITKDSGSPEDTIIVSEGSCYDSTKTVVLSLGSSTSKQNLNQGASTTYYVYIIGNSTGSLIDILISESSVTPGLPAGYSLFRQIGSYTTNSDGHIDLIKSELLSELGVKSIISTYKNGNSWYRIWSDGWCEQGGLAYCNGSFVSLLKAYSSIEYNIQITPLTSPYEAVSISACDRTTTGFYPRPQSGTGNPYGQNGFWQACGYIN